MLHFFGELQVPKRGEQMSSAAFELADLCLPALGCGYKSAFLHVIYS